jgi:hypothetical protein
MKTKIERRFLLAVLIAGYVFGSQQMKAQSTIPATQTPVVSGSVPVPGTYDPRSLSTNYSVPSPNTHASPNNQSPAGQADPFINQNTNPVRPDPAQPGLNPNSSPILQPARPDVNNNKQVSPNDAGNVNPAKKDSLQKEQ